MFADADGDGRPDLYVTMNFTHPMPELFYRNLGRGRFTEEAQRRGIADFDGGSHGACFADLANDRFEFARLDRGLNRALENGYPYLMIKIYTGPNAPAWIYAPESVGGGGVPAVTTEPPGYYGQPYPYFLSRSFKTLFKRMIDRVAAHVRKYPPHIRQRLIAIQAPIGRSGDAAGYYGKPTDPTYAITGAQWREYSMEMFGYYYRAYQNSDPPIVPIFNTGDYKLHAWMKEHIPRFWRKNALGGHFYQQHNVFASRGEAFRQDSLKYQADGWAMRSRDEMDKTPYSHGIWKEVTADIVDGNFRNRCPHGTDIVLTNLDKEDDVFHMIELTKALAP